MFCLPAVPIQATTKLSTRNATTLATPICARRILSAAAACASRIQMIIAAHADTLAGKQKSAFFRRPKNGCAPAEIKDFHALKPAAQTDAFPQKKTSTTAADAILNVPQDRPALTAPANALEIPCFAIMTTHATTKIVLSQIKRTAADAVSNVLMHPIKCSTLNTPTAKRVFVNHSAKTASRIGTATPQTDAKPKKIPAETAESISAKNVTASLLAIYPVVMATSAHASANPTARSMTAAAKRLAVIPSKPSSAATTSPKGMKFATARI